MANTRMCRCCGLQKKEEDMIIAVINEDTAPYRFCSKKCFREYVERFERRMLQLREEYRLKGRRL